MSPDSLINRITKLFSLAGNNPSEAEAEAAAAKAAELMAEHNISLAQVAAAQAQNDTSFAGVDAEYVRVTDVNTRNEWIITLASVVAKACDGKVVYSKGRPNSGIRGYIDFFGPKGSVESTIALFRYLEFQFPGLATSAFVKAKAEDPYIPHGKRFKNSYLHGLVQGISDRLTEMRRKVDENNSSALVVLSKAVDKKVGDIHPRLSYRRTRLDVDGSSYLRGQNDAGKVDLNQPKLSRQQYALNY